MCGTLEIILKTMTDHYTVGDRIIITKVEQHSSDKDFLKTTEFTAKIVKLYNHVNGNIFIDYVDDRSVDVNTFNIDDKNFKFSRTGANNHLTINGVFIPL